MGKDLEGKLATALAAAQRQYNKLIKDSENPFYKSKYADLAACIESCRDALAENGLAVSQTTDVLQGGDFTDMVLVTTLMHTSGESIMGRYPIRPVKGEAATPQDYGAAMTYARRYALCGILGIASEDDDGNSASSKGNPGSHQTHRDAPTIPAAPHPPTPTLPAQPAPSTPPPQAPQKQAANNAGFAGDVMVSGTVKDVVSKAGVTRGKPWKLYTVVVTDAAGVDHSVGTFDTNAGDAITSDKGKRVLINAYRTNKGNLAFEEYKRVDAPAPTAPEQQDKDNPMPF